MKISILFITLYLSVIASYTLPAHATSAEQNANTPLYIDNIHIVDVTTGKVLKNRQLKIRKGKIIAINAAQTPITDGSHEYLDGKGHYAMPGLIDMHAHAYDSAAFVIALSHGVTHLRLMNGVQEHLLWRKELENGSRVGSTITVSSPITSGFTDAHMHYSAQTPADAITAVTTAKQLGYDLIKAYGNLTAEVLRALLLETKKQNIPVAKHGPHPVVDMNWNELKGLQSLEHVEDIYQGPLNYQNDQKALDETIATLKTLNTPVTPTLNIYWQLTQISDQKQTFIDTLPEGYISPLIELQEKHNQLKRWINSPLEMALHNKKTLAFLQEITLQLYKANITLLVGSDSGVLLSPHGLATHKEMELMHQAGLPILAVLRAATINPAKALEKESQLGKIAVGYNADLILSEHNPLDTLATLKNPVWVVKQGRIFSNTELKTLRQHAIDKRSLWQEMRILLNAGLSAGVSTGTNTGTCTCISADK